MKLYLKKNIEKGQVFGIKGPTGNIRQVCRLFPNRPTDLIEKDSKTLIERYPHHVGDWSKTDERAKQTASYQKFMKKKRESLKGLNKPDRGPAARPIVADPRLKKIIQRGKDISREEWDEEISEEEANSPLYNQGMNGTDTPIKQEPVPGPDKSMPKDDVVKAKAKAKK